jgi:hypothetical protein
MVEFGLVAAFLVPICLGVVGVGLALGDAVKVSQTVRDAGHMFGRGIDFDRDDNKDIIVRLAGSLGMTRAGGSGTVIFSKIITPRQEDCEAANKANNCPNRDLPVITHRVAVGNTALRSSAFGTPAAHLVSATGNISPLDYLTQSSALANGFSTVMSDAGMVQNRGEIAYVVEGFFRIPSFGFMGDTTSGVYCRYIF